MKECCYQPEQTYTLTTGTFKQCDPGSSGRLEMLAGHVARPASKPATEMSSSSASQCSP